MLGNFISKNHILNKNHPKIPFTTYSYLGLEQFLYSILLYILDKIQIRMIISKANPPFKVKLLSIIPYIIQGMFCGFVSSIPLSYTTIPSYYIFSLFAIDAMPFSFKFLTAPIVERWSWDSYGKRKTWIVSMIILCSLLLYVIAEISYTQTEEYQKYVAVILFFSILFTTLKDVATDSFVVEVFDSSTVSVLQYAGAEFGKVATSPLFLYVVTSKTFNFSMSTIRKTYIQIVGTIGLLVAVIIHFFFDQSQFMKDYAVHHHLTSIQSQEQKIKTSFSKIFAHYKKFIDQRYRLFRFAILLLLINQGSEIFMDAYPVELIKMGIPRDTLMFGQNMCFVPNLVISFVFCSLVDGRNCYSYYYFSTFVKYFFMVFVYCLDLKDQTYAVPWYMVLYFVGSIQYFLQNVCITQESKGQFSGLSITLLLSISNLSRLTVLQKMAMDIFGYDQCVLFGFMYCLVILFVVLRCYGWLQRGISLKLVHLKKE